MQDLHVPGNRKYKGSRLFLYRDNRSQQRVFRGRMQCVSKGRCSVKAEDEAGYVAYDDDGQEMYNCVAWMPLPEPYKEAEDE